MEQRFETFTALITNISRSIRRIKTEEMEKFNLKSPHASCLYYLYKEGSLTAKDLCERCDEDKANMSRSIDHLENNGYIVCKASTHKRYRAPLEITELGREVGRNIAETIDSVLFLAGEGVSEKNRRIMYDSLMQISDNLQKICDSYISNDTQK